MFQEHLASANLHRVKMAVGVLAMAFRIFAHAQKDSQDNTAKKD